jgi:nitroreductase
MTWALSPMGEQMSRSAGSASTPAPRGALELIFARRSPPKLREPAPDEAALNLMLTAAMCGPDHGRLKPWRFIVVSGQGRENLGDLFAEALKRRDPNASDDVMKREREKALRAPMIVVVVARVQEHKSVPAVEQLIAAGIAAYNLLLGASGLGFGGMWRTGPAAYDEVVKTGLGVDTSETIVGFMYLGTPETPAPERKLPALDAFITRWPDRRAGT